jgi:putative transposase
MKTTVNSPLTIELIGSTSRHDRIVSAANLVELGGDVGVVNALALSDGTIFDLPRMSDKEKRKEANLARRVSRRRKGSRNRLRAHRDLRRFQARIARRRRDAKHKMTTAVVRRCDVLYLEDLRRSRRLARTSRRRPA